MFFGPIGKTRWPPWPLIGWDIFTFSSETAERNSTKLDRKQDLNALYQVCVFWADRKNKMAALASDWLRHFRLLWRNRWTEFNETWQEANSHCLLPRLCFFRPIGKKQNGRPGLWLTDFFFLTFPLKPLIFLVPFQHFSRIHCTQVSDSGPFGLLLIFMFSVSKLSWRLCHHSKGSKECLRWSSCKCCRIFLRYSSTEQWTTSKKMATLEPFLL